MSIERLDRVLVPVLLASSSAAVILGVVMIWSPADSELVRRLLQTSVVLAIGSGFVLSATRLGGSGVRREG
jgi:hypothetical protein